MTDESYIELRRLALCFLSQAVTLEAMRAHLGELVLHPVSNDVLEVTRDGFAVRITRFVKLSDVIREAEFAEPKAKRYGSALVVETGLGPSYKGIQYGTAMGGWLPISFGNLGPMVHGPFVAAEALAACEQLNALSESLVWDLVLGRAYPKG